ncbi:MAG: HD-GYP domain-containing protein [Betaproteobacteria bacterium]
MLKKIDVKHLRVGMHLHEFCGSWMDHPFWRTRFVITSERDVELVRGSSIHEVWIDVSKGDDVKPGIAVEESEEDIDRQVIRAAAQPPEALQKTTTREELQRAAKICAKSKDAVVSMFQEARMGNAIDAQNAMPLVEEISNSVARNPGALISLARLKTSDDYTYLHSVAVCALMIALSKQLNLDEKTTREAGMAGLLHDLGKAVIPNEILGKPGKLTDEEFEIVKTHPVEGHKMLLEGSGVGEIPLEVCLHHHEKMDGSGYPDRLPGDKITLMAKMGAVCDVYDAITSNRPYKAGWDPAESLRRMAEWKGHFDPAVFQAFVKSLGIYPIGSFVRLQSGRLGVVVEQGVKSLLTPKVRVFFSAKAQAYITPEIVDLGRSAHDKITGREDPVKWGIRNVDEFWAGYATDAK